MLLSKCLLLVALVSLACCTHFRGGTISWTRTNSTSRVVNFRVVMHFFTGGVTPTSADLTLNFGNGAQYAPTASAYASNAVDGSGLIRTIIYTRSHTYSTLGTFGECCLCVEDVCNGTDTVWCARSGVHFVVLSPERCHQWRRQGFSPGGRREPGASAVHRQPRGDHSGPAKHVHQRVGQLLHFAHNAVVVVARVQLLHEQPVDGESARGADLWKSVWPKVRCWKARVQ